MPETGVSSGAQSLRVVAGIAAVLAGLFVVFVVGLVAIASLWDNSEGVVAVATSAFAVIGSVVGAYFGVKEGSKGTQNAIEAMNEHASRAQAFAAHIGPDQAERALEHAQRLASSEPVVQRVRFGPASFRLEPDAEEEPETEIRPEPEQES